MVGTVILGCLIVNIILLAIFALVIFLLFRKFQPKLAEVKTMAEEVAEKLKPAIDSVERLCRQSVLYPIQSTPSRRNLRNFLS